MQVYITEICTSEWRTTFNAGLSAFYMIAMVMVYTLGKPDLLNWRWLAGVSCIFPILSIVFLGFIPESPAWLVTQGRKADARKALVWLRGPKYDITEEFDKLEASYAKTQKGKEEETGRKVSLENIQQTFRKLGRPDVFKPLLLVTTLSALQQFTGTATTTYYAVEILEVMGEGGGLDKYNATIIYGLIRCCYCQKQDMISDTDLCRLLSTFMGGLLLRRFARRPLLIVSSLFVALGMSLLGASNYISFNQPDLGNRETTMHFHNHSMTTTTAQDELQEPEGTEKSFFLNLLPLIGINMVAVSYQLGIGPIGWAYIGELYPVDMRTLLSGFSSMMVNVFIFIVIKTYPSLKVSALESWGTYWLYASISVLGALFGATLLPETKGKALAEISEHFYVCCTLNKKRQQEDVEYDAITDEKSQDTTLSQSFYFKHHDKARDILKDHKAVQEEEIERRFKRRSMEVGDKEGSLKRRTRELSMLEEEIQQKAEVLREQEKKLKLKSAPIVQLDELDELLTED